jgi:hypothetical protein
MKPDKKGRNHCPKSERIKAYIKEENIINTHLK